MYFDGRQFKVSVKELEPTADVPHFGRRFSVAITRAR
jgi:hypothetical protein